MSTIAYDPVKDKFARIIRRSRLLRRVFYFLLDLFFLRSWHIRRLIKKNARQREKNGEWQLLDAGSGFGQYDRFLLKHFNRVFVHSVDVKKDYMEDNEHYFMQEIERGEIRFEVADLLEFSSDEIYDMVLCIDVLEHIEQDRKVMKNLADAIRPGGYFLMHSPSHYSEEDAGEETTFVGEHARTGYSKEEISEKLQSVGLTPVNVHYTYGFWGHKAWIFSVKIPMLWFNKFGMAAALLLLIWYPLVMPFCLLMNLADLYTKNEKGNGIYALARKK